MQTGNNQRFTYKHSTNTTHHLGTHICINYCTQTYDIHKPYPPNLYQCAFNLFACKYISFILLLLVLLNLVTLQALFSASDRVS